MSTVVRRNERSWAIELISHINETVKSADLVIKKAGGESTVSVKKGSSMFPDVILYGNKSQSIILQGWELKMPDVPIEDKAFIKDAQRKAEALGLNSCIIWNFTYVVLYAKNEQGNFEKIRQWDDTSKIRTRDDVETYRSEWEKLLEKVILDINDYFIDGTFRQSLLQDVISSTTLTTLITRNQAITAELLENKANTNAVLNAYISNWWSEVKIEYEHDEQNQFSAYAKSIILNWANRITFAHIIKHKQNSARIIDTLDYKKKAQYGNKIFSSITQKCDFFNVFEPIKYNEILPELTWQDLVEYSVFLKDNGIDKLDHTMLQNILEGSVNQIKRELNGQYTTPRELAKLLVLLTVTNWKSQFMDCCCGTGTIPKAALEIKKSKFSAKEAVESVWASDKYNYPLQVANISMASAETINLANRLFQHNALTLRIGESIELIDPENGAKMQLVLPTMDAIATNLPFVEFESLPEDDSPLLSAMAKDHKLDNRSDYSFYIALKISELLRDGGRLGIIISNSWLGTKAGRSFIKAIEKVYDVLQVHISGNGRWFNNAKVVTTIIILKKKDCQPENEVKFFFWKKSLGELSSNPEFEQKLINSALLGTELDSSVVTVSNYSYTQVDSLLNYNISYNALFHQVNWFERLGNKTVPIKDIFDVFRGNRRGWDALFYPKTGEHSIENVYLKKVLMNAKSVDYLIAKPDRDAFCCNVEITTLERLNHTGALEWINRFVQQKNKTGKPLPEVLKQKGVHWYEQRDNEIAELFTMMNPDKRLFFAVFQDSPAFINQRLIGFNRKDKTLDLELCHALLNSVLTMFSIEASGFGRGQGVLDTSKTNLANCRMFNPVLINDSDKEKIIESFRAIKSRRILNVSEELTSSDRIQFEKAVFSAFNLESTFSDVVESLLSLQRARETVKN